MATMPPRPVARPSAPPPKPKKSTGLMTGLIIAIVLALVGFGGAGFLFSKQGGLTAENNAHQAAAATAAETLGVAMETNAPTDWTELWSKINSSISVLRGENQRQTARIGEMEGDLQTAAGLQTALQTAQADAQRNAQQVTTLSSELNALKESSSAAVHKLEAELNAAKSALEAAEARIEAPLASQPEDALPAEGKAADANGKVAATVATAGVAATVATAEAAAGTETEVEKVAPPVKPSSFDFQVSRKSLLKSAAYNPKNETMKVVLFDDTPITYRGVPYEMYEKLTSLTTFDTFYRMKILGAFPADVDDKATVRTAEKNR